MISFFYLLFYGLCYVLGCNENPYFKDAGPLVKTMSGSVVGKYVKVFDTKVAAFLGIPYAKPPLGEKRFQKPDPIEPWDGILLVDKISPPCMQYTTRNFSWFPTTEPSEDCLYLNIWTPTRCCCDSHNKLPVLVWIHGGAFFSGSTDIDIYDGSIIASFGETIVVSMNYRLGIFGFLDDGTELAPGNMGMHDQTLALKWIQKNIHYFGGDSKSITLFGESAGAISISMHMTSPLSKDLFHRAIMQSGSAYNPGFTEPISISIYKRNLFAPLVGCSEESDPLGITHCLKQKDALQLAKAENLLTSKFPSSFMPTVGNEFLPKHPIDMFDSGELATVDVLTGVLSDEGSIFLNYIKPDTFPLNQQPSLTLNEGKAVMKELFRMIPENATEILSEFYFQNLKENDSPAIVKGIIDAFGDFVFNCPMMLLAEKAKNSYVYWITHRSLKNPRNDWVGATHFDEVPYVFGKPIVDTKNYTPEDGRFSGDLIQKWVSFARTGYPLNKEDKYTWPRFSSSSPVVCELNPRSTNCPLYPRKESCEFLRPFLKMEQV